ncbi:hypothetical protein B0T17DRAFT_531665 [Bombardia bombarda]|uniref:Uncharacterized protein n=1 Tax=Bombardia bombarda TaxID=252184 RepID=A0AA40C517_9PEZI|nr:hypothetical protein B0T17DRAFT_531665 [Bombardia bombarda]
MPSEPPSAPPGAPAVYRHADLIEFAYIFNVELPETDYYPANTKPEDHDDDGAYFFKQLDTTIKFLETAAFAIPEAGVMVSAGIGALWSAVQPGALHKYNESVEQIVARVTSAQLELQSLKEARDAINTFHTALKTDLNYALPQSSDDLPHAEDIARRYASYVRAGGLVLVAFARARDNLPWFQPSTIGLIIVAAQAIVQSYQLAVRLWMEIGVRNRNSDNISGYNKAWVEVVSLVAEVPETLRALKKSVVDRVDDMQKARATSAAVHWKMRDTSNLDHRYHKGHDWREHGYVLDTVSQRELLKFSIKPTTGLQKTGDVFKTIGGIILSADEEDLKPNGNNDDAAMAEVGESALDVYRRRLLPAHWNRPFAGLNEGMDRVLRQAEKLTSLTAPNKPRFPPTLIKTGTHIPDATAADGLRVGDKVSYKFTLQLADKGAPVGGVLQSSEWSGWVECTEAGKIPEMYIGDGFAATNTARKIYQRREATDSEGKLVATVVGHGILTWPSAKHHSSV